MKKQIAILFIGLGLFGFVAVKVGWSDVARQLQAVCVAVPILLVLSGLRALLQTAAWSGALRVHGIRASAVNLAGARLASRAMGYLSVLGPLVSEPMRISLLDERSPEATAATLMDTSVYWISCWFFTIFATICAAHFMSGPKRIASLLMLAPLACGAVFMMIRRKPVLPGFAGWIGDRCPLWLRKAEQTEVGIRDFQAQHPECVRRMFAYGLACQILMAAELLAIFLALHIPFEAGTILGLESASRVVRTLGGWLPARVGIDESGMAAAALTFGLSSLTGLSIALARRIRDLTEALAGFCWLAWRSRSVGRRVAPVAPRVRAACA